MEVVWCDCMQHLETRTEDLQEAHNHQRSTHVLRMDWEASTKLFQETQFTDRKELIDRKWAGVPLKATNILEMKESTLYCNLGDIHEFQQ